MLNNRILCVDDEPNVLNGLRRQLRKNFDVSTAVSGMEALELMAHQGPFPVVISDYNMPTMDGVEFLAQVKQRFPDTVSIMLTGRSELDIAVAALHQGNIFRFLNKPADPELLQQSILDAMEHYRLVNAERELTAELQSANSKLAELNQNLETKVTERTATLRRLYRFVSKLNSLDSQQEVAVLTVNTAASMLNCAEVSLWSHEPDIQQLRMQASTSTGLAKQLTIPVENSALGHIFSRNEIFITDLSSPDLESTAWDKDIVNDLPALYVPLATQSKASGILVISASAKGGYDHEDISIAHALAHSTAIALSNHQHREERDETQDAVIMALAKLSESKDLETGGHLLRLKAYCRLLCEALQLFPGYRSIITPGFIKDIERSSPLHDIGKVGIPDHILKKPGKHTPEEFELMKTHATIGGDTLKSVLDQCKYQGFIKTGMEIAYGHHERWDGSGYPIGLKGLEIPLSARILALADVFDALTSKRAYKPAFSFEQTRRIIIDGRGSHFDPDLVDAFLFKEQEFIETALQLAEISE